MNAIRDAGAPTGIPPSLPLPATRLVGRLYRLFAAERVVLFGSFARGQWKAGSDIDLLVVLPDETRREEVERRREQLASGLFPPVDLVITTSRELEEARGERAAFLRNVLQHGIEVTT